MHYRPTILHPQRRPAAEWDSPFAPASVRLVGRVGRQTPVLEPEAAAPNRPAAIYRALGLREDPFPCGPEPDGEPALVPAITDQARRLADWATEPGTGRLAIVTGQPRAGRSTLVRHADRLLASSTVAVLTVDLAPFGSSLTDGLLLRAVVAAFGEVPTGRSGLDIVRQIQALASGRAEAERTPLLMLDGADLAGSQLDTVRAILSAIEPGPDALRMVITGPPELRDRVRRRRSLADHLALDLPLAPVGVGELAAFIQDRIATAALDAEDRANDGRPLAVVAPEAVEIIAGWSEGIIGPAIELAGECLLEAIARGTQRVDEEIAHDLVREFTDRAREIARQQAASPFARPAVQARFSFPVAFGEENAIPGGSSPATTASHGTAGGQQ